MSWQSYLAFCSAAMALALIPGPTVSVIVANSLRFGARAGLLNVLGTQLGVVLWLALAALGLQALIATMGVWFDVIRIAGALYLIWLGIKLLRSDGTFARAARTSTAQTNFLLQGFIVILSNPKMLVLFSALLPPFLTPGGDTFRETLTLGATFMAIAAVGDTCYALLAGKAGAWLSRSRLRAVEIIGGLCLASGGVWMALRGR
jgi:homoserine/homoserine lactone efflux protein